MSSGKDALTTTRGKMSAAGIVDDPSTQTRVIPESRRADGSIRKERKVKPGFTPAEDVGRFRPSRVLRAQEEAAAKHTKGPIPGSESYTLSSSSSSSPSAVEAARKALAKSSIAETSASSSPLQAVASSSSSSSPYSSSEQPGPPLPAARSDGPWRRATPATAKVESSSNGLSHAGASWRHQPKPAVTSTTSSNCTSRESTWRRPVKKDDDKGREGSIPDSWDTEDNSSSDAQAEKERPDDTDTSLTQQKDEDDSIGKIAEKLDSLKVGNSKEGGS